MFSWHNYSYYYIFIILPGSPIMGYNPVASIDIEYRNNDFVDDGSTL